jgi:hypothetical protein
VFAWFFFVTGRVVSAFSFDYIFRAANWDMILSENNLIPRMLVGVPLCLQGWALILLKHRSVFFWFYSNKIEQIATETSKTSASCTHPHLMCSQLFLANLKCCWHLEADRTLCGLIVD